MRDSPAKLARKDEELRAADLVVLASNFTRQTLPLAGLEGKQIAVIPYGSPEPVEEPSTAPFGTKLRILFVGGLGQRKGLSYLLKAVRMLGRATELTLLGRKAVETCTPLNDATRRHRWIPSLPHAEVLREMERHDILVCPSLFEGFGLVILEAMSRGKPVITTPNTAGPDIITDELDGFIVPIRSAEAIAVRLEELANVPEKLRAIKHAAWQTAGLFAWETYRRNLARLVRGALASSDLMPSCT